MSALKDDSKLYKTLEDMYGSKKSKDISESFFCECIEVALKYSKREIQFVLFKLKLLSEDTDSGLESVDSLSNSIQKVLDALTGKNTKRTFFIKILEIALEEKTVSKS